MRLLVIGNGQGSWQIRGEQIGTALGARVTTFPTADDFAWADVVVLVKRAAARFAATCHRLGKPIVWDALDFWSQPGQNHWPEPLARELLRQQLQEIRPALVIGATDAMAAVAGGRSVFHHCWSHLRRRPVREHIQVVAYEGNPAFLGRWEARLFAACRRRGWHFVVNPADLADADLIVGFRDGMWDGWMCREWKSGVKVVNAMAAGRPFISQASAAVRELQPVGTTVGSAQELADAFDAWRPLEARLQAQAQQAYTVHDAAVAYRSVLAQVAPGVAA